MELNTAIEILEYHQEWRLGKREDMIHEPKKLTEAIDIVLSEVKKFRLGAVSCWVAFDWNKIETRPTEYGKYLICRKDGKIHWETWNGIGWAYNHNEIRFWAVIVPPCS